MDTENKLKTDDSHNRRRPRRGKIILALIAILAVAAAVFFIRNELNPSNPTTAQLIEQISKHIIPPDEEPSITTIENAAEMKQRSGFFSRIEDGDKILIFPKAAQIYIYRPSTDRLINVGPILDDTKTTE